MIMTVNFMENYRKHTITKDGSHDNTFEFDCMFSEAVLATDIGYINAVITDVTICAQEAVTVLYTEANFITGIKNILSKIWAFIKKVLSGIKNIISKVISFITRKSDNNSTGTVSTGATRSASDIVDSTTNEIKQSSESSSGGNSDVHMVDIQRVLNLARTKFVSSILASEKTIHTLKELSKKVDVMIVVVDSLIVYTEKDNASINPGDESRKRRENNTTNIGTLKIIGNFLNFILVYISGLVNFKNSANEIFNRIVAYSEIAFAVLLKTTLKSNTEYSKDEIKKIEAMIDSYVANIKITINDKVATLFKGELIRLLTGQTKDELKDIVAIKSGILDIYKSGKDNIKSHLYIFMNSFIDGLIFNSDKLIFVTEDILTIDSVKNTYFCVFSTYFYSSAGKEPGVDTTLGLLFEIINNIDSLLHEYEDVIKSGGISVASDFSDSFMRTLKVKTNAMKNTFEKMIRDGSFDSGFTWLKGDGDEEKLLSDPSFVFRKEMLETVETVGSDKGGGLFNYSGYDEIASRIFNIFAKSLRGIKI